MYDTIQKTIVAWAFNNYVAYYYFDNVNVSQLKVAFEKGEVELENLPIKKEALKQLNFPLEVVSGIVGNLSIKVPLLTLLTDPWIIKIKNLVLMVTPSKLSTADELTQETLDQSNLNESYNLYNDTNDATTNSEETKLAEFYSSFSATMSSIVKDIFKNIRLEIESMTILFEEFDYGVVKFNVDSLLLHRPKSARNLVMDNASIYLSNVGGGDDLLRVSIENCNIDIYDEASNNMQLVVVQPDRESSSTSNYTPPTPPQTTSETKFDCNLKGVCIEQLVPSGRKKSASEKQNDSRSSESRRIEERISVNTRDVLKCDKSRIEFKLNNNMDDKSIKSPEKNLHIKLDLFGAQYIHSQKIYEITTQRLTNLLKFFIKLQSKKHNNQNTISSNQGEGNVDSIKKREETSNKLLNINIKEGLVYIVDDTSGSSAIPLFELSLEDCAIYHISGKYQQDGFIFAKVGCNHFNREVSTWSPLLKPWPFNLNWRIESGAKSMNRRPNSRHRKIELTSDEVANFVLSSAFLDLSDAAFKRIFDDFMRPKLWPLATDLRSNSRGLSKDFNSIFVIHNETGHMLHVAPLEQSSELYEAHDSSKSSTSSADGICTPLHRLSVHSKSSVGSRDSPDLSCLTRWISVDVDETLPFEFETLPVYRRHNSDMNPRSRTLLVRVEGWKTLDPISIDKTGVFFLQAFSDRVMNEDTHIVVSIDLEQGSARKIISIRSPLNLVNMLDATVEVHFANSRQALYMKPDSHLAVPLPYLFDKIHIRPCNVGVTMSEKALLWDEIQHISDQESKIHVCHPITVTNERHKSYCTSRLYRICVSARHDGPKYSNFAPYTRIPVYSMSFIPPLTIVNLLPCKIQYFIGDIDGLLTMGSQQRIYHVDTTKATHVNFKMNGFPLSKPISIDPGATGSFQHTLEMFDKKNRSLYLNAKIILSSQGEEPAMQVIIYSPFWFINKTKLPLIFKQEGAASEAAGQFREHEESPSSILLFSFYDIDIEQPWLCGMRLGKSKGLSMWCDGFKLEKGSGERKLCFIPEKGGDSKMNKSLIDINIRRGFGRYSDTMIVTFTARYGFDPLTKTPKKANESSPQNYKLTSYNHNTNLAERIAGQAVNLFSNHYHHRGTSDIDLKAPGLKLTLVDNNDEKFIEVSADDIMLSCATRAKEQILDCSIQDLRIYNVLPDCEKVIMLDRAADANESINVKPAVRLIMDRILGNSFGTTLFKQVQLSMCELVLNIEEKLVLKFVEFISFRNRKKREHMNNLSHDLEKILHPEDDRMSKYYFDLLRIDLSSLKLSVFTTTNLTNSLQKLKSCLGLKFFAFEDAQVLLSPYLKMNVSRTCRGVFESVTRFYKRQILEQAPRIVGQQIQNYLRFHLSDLLSTLYDEVYNKLFN